MKVKIFPSIVKGSVFAPPSKSYTHRAIVIGSLGESCWIKYPLISADTKATINACRAIGASIVEKENMLEIKGVQGKPETPDNVIDAMNSGTTLRIMAAVCSLAKGASVLTGDDSLRRRPNTPLLIALQELGAVAFSTKGDGTAPLVIKGRLKGGRVAIDGSISSQFITALLIACPLAEEQTQIEIKGKLISKPYVEITLELLEKADVNIDIQNNFTKFGIPPNQSYKLKNYQIPGDFSSASYMLAAGAITNSRVEVKNLYPSKQGDVEILEILKQMGSDIHWDRDAGIVRVAGIGGEVEIDVDANQFPDLVPTLAAIAACTKGKTRIYNVEHARYKETDRLHTIATELKKMGAKIIEQRDGLIVKSSKLKGAEVTGYGDHRIVMALAIAALAAEGPTIIDTAECVDVSYPSFFEDLKKLGARVEYLK
ncbi:MAG: 3-phosphoshikimate 1-carboxyvinyltransferase [Methanocellales archaeon]